MNLNSKSNFRVFKSILNIEWETAIFHWISVVHFKVLNLPRLSRIATNKQKWHNWKLHFWQITTILANITILAKSCQNCQTLQINYWAIIIIEKLISIMSTAVDVWSLIGFNNICTLRSWLVTCVVF